MINYFTPDLKRRITCFGCSVANALIEMGDVETAKIAYDNSGVHPDCENGEFRDIVASKYFRDLTQNRYQAIHTRVKLEVPLIEALKHTGDRVQKFVPTDPEALIKIIEEKEKKLNEAKEKAKN